MMMLFTLFLCLPLVFWGSSFNLGIVLNTKASKFWDDLSRLFLKSDIFGIPMSLEVEKFISWSFFTGLHNTEEFTSILFLALLIFLTSSGLKLILKTQKIILILKFLNSATLHIWEFLRGPSIFSADYSFLNRGSISIKRIISRSIKLLSIFMLPISNIWTLSDRFSSVLESEFLLNLTKKAKFDFLIQLIGRRIEWFIPIITCQYERSIIKCWKYHISAYNMRVNIMEVQYFKLIFKIIFEDLDIMIWLLNGKMADLAVNYTIWLNLLKYRTDVVTIFQVNLNYDNISNVKCGISFHYNQFTK